MKTKARIAGVFYLITFVAGSASLALTSGKIAVDLIAELAYVGVTVLFYQIFKPVNRNISLLAAIFSLAGITNGALMAFHRAPTTINPLVFFGFYCLLIGYLIIRSTFLPRIFGVLMAIGGLGWLTFMSPTLSHSLYPYNLAPGMIGEGALTLWLLVVGLN
ncbi:MAG TPA: DUF4386 domain-containing protein, partial [Gemmatimonadaceae bacterium]|nr:DUF4386 domain-containing protein [Gemmatimonadaceae bacterium]